MRRLYVGIREDCRSRSRLTGPGMNSSVSSTQGADPRESGFRRWKAGRRRPTWPGRCRPGALRPGDELFGAGDDRMIAVQPARGLHQNLTITESDPAGRRRLRLGPENARTRPCPHQGIRGSSPSLVLRPFATDTPLPPSIRELCLRIVLQAHGLGEKPRFDQAMAVSRCVRCDPSGGGCGAYHVHDPPAPCRLNH